MPNDRHALTASQTEALEQDGYVIFPDVLPSDHVAALEQYLDERVAAQLAGMLKDGETTGAIDWGPERVVINLELNPRHPLLEVCGRHPLLLAAVTHVLGVGPVLKKMHCRAPLPGGGHQGLHSDLQNAPVSGRWLEVQCTWCIRAHTEHNGPTRVIPGFHRSADPPIGQEFGAGHPTP